MQNVRRQKSTRPSPRRRQDIIRILQAFSQACVSLSEIASSVPPGLTSPSFVTSLTNQRPIEWKMIFMTGKCDSPEEMEASCYRLNVSGCTGIISLYHIGSAQLLVNSNSLCLWSPCWHFLWKHGGMFAPLMVHRDCLVSHKNYITA